MESRLNTTSTSPCVLVVDDDPSILSQLRLALSREFEVLTAGDSDTAWRVAQREHPELVTLDLALDDNDPETGFRLLEQLVRFDPFMKVVLVTGNDHESNALRSVEQGAADFFAKPVDAAELTVLLRRVLARGRLERQCAATLQQLGDDLRLGSILGQSSSMQLLFRRI